MRNLQSTAAIESGLGNIDSETTASHSTPIGARGPGGRRTPMHQPKRLSRQAIQPAAGLAWLAQEALDRDTRERIRSALTVRAIFKLLAWFRRDVELCAMPATLAASANAALELTRLHFALLAWQPRCCSQGDCDCSRCITELEGLVGRLSGGDVLQPAELVHAMDALIASLVRTGIDDRLVERAAA